MNRSEDNTVDRGRLEVIFGSVRPRYVTVAEAAQASGFSRQAVYRAIDRGELGASVVCSRLRIHPDDFLDWMEGERATTATAPLYRTDRIGTRKTPADDGLRSLLVKQQSSAA